RRALLCPGRGPRSSPRGGHREPVPGAGRGRGAGASRALALDLAGRQVRGAGAAQGRWLGHDGTAGAGSRRESRRQGGGLTPRLRAPGGPAQAPRVVARRILPPDRVRHRPVGVRRDRAPGTPRPALPGPVGRRPAPRGSLLLLVHPDLDPPAGAAVAVATPTGAAWPGPPLAQGDPDRGRRRFHDAPRADPREVAALPRPL